MTTINNISQDFFSKLNNYASNPIILVVFILVILIYYILFAFIGKSNNDDSESSGGFVLFEGLLWGIFILLIFVNGIYYFYNINIITEFNNIFSNEPEIVIEKTLDLPEKTIDISNKEINNNEVYHIPGNRFTYHDAKAVCNAFDGELATYDQLNKSLESGSNWCSYGWTKDQLGLYPTSQNHFNKMQKREGHEYDCGLPGINGGYVSNPHTRLGANCYGLKPKKSKLESEYLDNQELYPKSQKELLFEERVKYWKNRIGNILINPFNNNNWFKNQQIQAQNLKKLQDAKIEAVKAEKIKMMQQNKVKLAEQDSKLANVSADTAKKRSQILNTDTNIIS